MKIFNRQRMNLFQGKRIQKYMLYAFGEIILVVVGILIAVGINQYNQKKQLDNANAELEKQVIAQLEDDILEIERYQKELDTLQHSYLKVLNRPYDTTKVPSGSIIGTILLQVSTITLNSKVINFIDNAALNNSRVSQDLIDISSMYKIYMKEIGDTEVVIFDALVKNLKEIESTQDWYVEFITDFKCKNDCINFLLNDQQHKARMASLRFLYVNGYGGIIDALKNDLQEALDELTT